MEHARPKLWTKDFILVSSINFFLTLIFYLLIVTISVYAVETFDASTSEAGLITGIFIIGILSGRLFIGRVIDSLGRRKTLFIGLSFFTLATLLYFMNLGIAFLMVNRLLHGMALGIASTAAGTIVAESIPVTRKGEGIGYYSMSATLATAIGPFIGLYMSQHTSYQIIFSFSLAIGVISLITAFFVEIHELEALDKTANKLKGFNLSNYVEPKALPIGFITFALGIAYASILSYINFYAIEIDLVKAASFFFIFYSIAILLSRPVTGRLMDLKGANYVMYPAFIVYAAGMLLLSQVSNSITLLLAGLIIGLGFGNMQSCAQAIAVKITSPHRMGYATSTFYIFLDAGLGFGPYFIGLMIPLTGYRTLYAIMALFIILTGILYYFLYGKKEHAQLANTIKAS